jgi:pimeloyl-ACP methyl ester carboxylesterase
MKRNFTAAMLLLATLLGPCAARSEERIELSGQSGIALPIIYDAVAKPTVSVILFVGGDGDLAHETDSFLLRVRSRFVAAGMSVAVPDTPSDHPGGFAAIVAFLKRQAPVPVWVVGTSNGTISAASSAAYLGPTAIQGVVLTSSVWLGGLGLVPVEKIAVPVLIVHDRDDSCPASQFFLEEKNLPRLELAPVKKLIAVTGGGDGGPRCGTGSPHDFYGIDNEVMPPIIDWIKAHE